MRYDFKIHYTMFTWYFPGTRRLLWIVILCAWTLLEKETKTFGYDYTPKSFNLYILKLATFSNPYCCIFTINEFRANTHTPHSVCVTHVSAAWHCGRNTFLMFHLAPTPVQPRRTFCHLFCMVLCYLSREVSCSKAIVTRNNPDSYSGTQPVVAYYAKRL